MPQAKTRRVSIDPNADPVTVRRVAIRMAASSMRESFETYFRFHPPGINYIYGKHTLEIIRVLDSISKDVAAGKCRYVCLCVPFRHGKSDIASRRWPAWYLGNNPDHEFMQVSYNDDLAVGFSRIVRNRFRVTGKLWGLQIDPTVDKVGTWGIAGHMGSYHATSFGGTVAGLGATILGIDDYCKDRESAESKRIREKTWESFTNDFLTRRAPVHAVVITANRWHEDDVVGRIIDCNDPSHPRYLPNFPKFEIVKFASQNEDGSWLFPERFPEAWYLSNQAQMGSYAWGAMGQQDPKPRRGKLLRADQVTIVDPPEWARMKMVRAAVWNRGWDLASTKKEIAVADPDASCGTKAAVVDNCILVDDEIHGHWRGTTRNKIIENSAEADGVGVKVFVEVVAGYTDAYDQIKTALGSNYIVRKFVPVTDKVARASYMEPIFEAGKVYIKRAPWNAQWIDEFNRFPEGAHDDRVDSLITALYHVLAKKSTRQFTF